MNNDDKTSNCFTECVIKYKRSGAVHNRRKRLASIFLMRGPPAAVVIIGRNISILSFVLVQRGGIGQVERATAPGELYHDLLICREVKITERLSYRIDRERDFL